MINRNNTHKKIELSNEVYALLVDLKAKIYLQETKKGNYKNIGFSDVIEISLTHLDKKLTEKNNEVFKI